MSASNFVIREMAVGEEQALWQLFHETIHTVNKADYTPEQLAAWSSQDRDMVAWSLRMQEVQPFVVTVQVANSENLGEAAQIVGFSDLQSDGLVDFMFVHHAWQGCGVASCLMAEIERRAERQGLARLYAHVSLTAQPFFSSHGFTLVESQTVGVRGATLSNAIMERWL